MATVMLPGALVQLFPGSERKVEVPGATVSQVLDALNARWPGMRDRVADSSPAIRRHVMVFVDSERANLQTEVGAESRVEIIPSMSGG